MSFSRTVVHVLVFWKGARGRQRVRTWALDVADDGTGLVVHELDTALSDTTTGAYCYPSACHYLTLLHPPFVALCARLSQRKFGNFAHRFGQGHG